MIETAMVFDETGRVIYWHEPRGRSAGSIPDSRELWDVLWNNRDHLGGVAHTHPWNGRPSPSQTDVTTFMAIEAGLGRRLLWVVATMDEIGYYVYDDRVNNYMDKTTPLVHQEEWRENIEELRHRSQGEQDGR